MENLGFTWKIENFDLVRKSDEFIKHQKIKFQAGLSIGLPTDWCVYMQVTNTKRKKEDEEEKSWIGIFFQSEKFPSGCTEVNAIFEINIKKNLEEESYLQNTSKIISINNLSLSQNNENCTIVFKKLMNHRRCNEEFCNQQLGFRHSFSKR